MKTVLKVVVVLPAVLFIIMGVRWLVDPGGIAPEFGFVLGDGIGRSSQVGDFAAFFLTLGVCVLLGVVNRRRVWYYPPIMLLLLAATGRVLAWTSHDAAFAGGMIVFEVGVAALLLAASRWLPEAE
ncbi:MAG: hypothetical protein ACR2PS_16095 [Pseudomonadales bacterium]